jgi:Zn-dependent protease with chaperone function
MMDYLRNLWDILQRKGHRLLAVYLAINAIFATWILGSFMTGIVGHPIIGWILGFLLYILSLCIALSPIGEAYLRWKSGSRKIIRLDDISFLEPIFERVSKGARELNPNIPNDVSLFIETSKYPNALATGRKTICLTRGLLQYPPRVVEAVVAHEYGHLAHKDTDLLLLVTVGNLVVNVFFFILWLYAKLFKGICTILGAVAGHSLDERGNDGSTAGRGLGELIGNGVVLVFHTLPWMAWTKLGEICVLRAGRNNEYKADEFAFNLGYGHELCQFFDDLEEDGDSNKGFFALLQKTHPPKDDRIAKLQELGATYRNV